MFERYLTEAFTTHLGHFFKDIDTEKVRLSAWRGELLLQDLRLRQDALEVVESSPMEIVYGKIGTLELRVPWKLLTKKLLTSEGCSLVLSDVNIVIAPKRRDEQNENTAEKILTKEELRIRKEQEVQQLLDASLFKRVTASTQQSRAKRWGQALLESLLSTLTVTVQNIHIRYEDPGTALGFVWNPSAPRHCPAFAVGVMLRQFSVQTSSPEKEKQQGDTSEKDVAVYQLSVYWDSDCELVSHNVHKLEALQTNQRQTSQASDNFIDAVEEEHPDAFERDDYCSSAFGVLNGFDDGKGSFFHRSHYTMNHNYLLDPASPSLHLSLVNSNKEQEEPTQAEEKSLDEPSSDSLPASQRRPLHEAASPSCVTVSCPPCQFTISRNTLKDIVYLRKSLAVWSKSQKARSHESTMRQLQQLRPTLSPMQDPRQWWNYAFQATILLSKPTRHDEKQKRNCGWLGLTLALKERTKYVDLYSQLLSDSSSEDQRRSIHESLLAVEDTLDTSEIVAFRMAAYNSYSDSMEQSESSTARIEDTLAPSNMLLTLEHRCRMFNEMVEALKEEKRSRKRQEPFDDPSQTVKHPEARNVGESPIVWEIALVCPQLALQVKGELTGHTSRHRPTSTSLSESPIVQLSFASIHKVQIRRGASWDFNSNIASVRVEDLTDSKQNSFPYLLGPKRSAGPGEADDFVNIDREEHRHFATIEVKRKKHHVDSEFSTEHESAIVGTTTNTKVRVSPLEIVYVTDPFEALSRVFKTVKTPELVDDYYHMASVIVDWRRRQQQRLLNALAHREKQIFVDVNVAAPVVLIPEDSAESDSPLLVVDFGRLQFGNCSDDTCTVDQSFDDSWRLGLTDIQIAASSASSYNSKTAVETTERKPANEAFSRSHSKLVEPFSLEFKIRTSIALEESGQSRVHVTATLPRLAFNVSSSAIRLMLRLQLEWARRKSRAPKAARSSFLAVDTAKMFSFKSSSESPNNVDVKRAGMMFQFDFLTSLIALKLENDVDGRDCLKKGDVTPIVDLAFRDIYGTFIHEGTGKAGSAIQTFEAKLSSVDALDLYQTGGPDFALLLSSISPEAIDLSDDDSGNLLNISHGIDEKNDDILRDENRTDLVLVSYRSSPRLESENRYRVDDLKIAFHELYVEWNPETLAAIQKCVRLSPEEYDCNFDESGSDLRSEQGQPEDNDEFFDAIQHNLDEESIADSDIRLISEISSSRSTSAADLNDIELANSTFSLPLSPILSPRWQKSIAEPTVFQSLTFQSEKGCDKPGLKQGVDDHDEDKDASAPPRLVVVTFNLSKLRVRLNKESRHRRLLIAEMDKTHFRYTSSPIGGSKTVATLGNLVVSDPAKEDNTTIYGQILGLKDGAFLPPGNSKSSLLELEFIVHPRVRRLSPSDCERDIGEDAGVTIDAERGLVHGFDFCVTLNFSPMRFVFLEQLWMEVVDYFFVGILGNKVWGRRRPADSHTPPCVDPTSDDGSKRKPQSGLLHGVDAADFNFTGIAVTLKQPLIVIPITYRSPQHLRIECHKLRVTSRYNGKKELDESSEPGTEWFQWYNNLAVDLQSLGVSTWSGNDLFLDTVDSSTDARALNASISLNWPVGPTSVLIVPKWKVKCAIDRPRILLRRDDYALFQHIVTYNFGEPSRHLDEWERFQNLSLSEFEQYKSAVMVHFGYDKKDSSPATFDMTITTPSIVCSFKDDGATEDRVLEARCHALSWNFKKSSDRVSCQRIACNISLFQSVHGDFPLLRPVRQIGFNSQNDQTDIPCHENVQPADQSRRTTGSREGLVYTSKTRPSGDNVKSLEIEGTQILFNYPAWMKVKAFFQNLPQPEIMTHHDIQHSMQIGDRWYLIDAPGKQQRPSIPIAKKKLPTSSYVPSYQFHMLLISPKIVLVGSSEDNSEKNEADGIVLSLSHFDYLHHSEGQTRQMRRSFFVHNLEVHTAACALDGSHEKSAVGSSLIQPWSVCGSLERRHSDNIGNFDFQSLKVSSEVLRCRAAFSDMTKTVDVVLRLLKDYRQTNDDFSGHMKSPNVDIEPIDVIRKIPDKESIDLFSDGFEILVVDDSGRHFADAQQLIGVAIGSISFGREKHKTTGNFAHLLKQRIAADYHGDCLSTNLPFCFRRVILCSFEVTDYLQGETSRFRHLASSFEIDRTAQGMRADVPRTDSKSRSMVWPQFASVDGAGWGFHVSSAFLERLSSEDYLSFESSWSSTRFTSENGERRPWVYLTVLEVGDGLAKDVDAKLGHLSLQWNPSTVIALQRFLGRLKKEAILKLKLLRLPNGMVLKEPSDLAISSEVDARKSTLATFRFRARLSLAGLNCYLNKEHQSRRLLEAALSGGSLVYEYDARFMLVDAVINDFHAWDPDDYELREISVIQEKNRSIARVSAPTNEMPLSNDCIDPENGEEKSMFMSLHYVKYWGSPEDVVPMGKFPSWVTDLLSKSRGQLIVQDYLWLSVAAVQFTYLKERTEELLDYLSNGLPGKGMGATSNAAKGFIRKRIKTRSFLEVHVSSPTVIVPQHESSSTGLSVRLGEVRLRSWFEEGSLDFFRPPGGDVISMSSSGGDGGKETWRILSLSLEGFVCSTFGQDNAIYGTINQPADMTLNLRKPTWYGRTLSINGTLSFVDMTLRYTTYVLVRALLSDNLLKNVRRDRWDNLEKDFSLEREIYSEKEGLHPTQEAQTPRLAYSTNARFIRYGVKSSVPQINNDQLFPSANDESSDRSKTWLDFKFEMDGISLTLHRDDELDDFGDSPDHAFLASFNYDIVLFRVQTVVVSVTTNTAGDKSIQISLHRIGIVDLGDSGRLTRERYYSSLKDMEVEGHREKERSSNRQREASAFFVLVEGYSSPNDGKDSVEDIDPQFLLTLDRGPESSDGWDRSDKSDDDTKVIAAKLVINYLVVNALIRPVKEILAFVSCSWSRHNAAAVFEKSVSERSISATPDEQPTKLSGGVHRSGFRLTLVAHYPRVFFCADEADINSRALVLHGLAVLNANVVKRSSPFQLEASEEHPLESQGRKDSKVVSSLDAHLYSVETYINPDVRDVLGLKPRHGDLVKGTHLVDYLTEAEATVLPDSDDRLLGVALMQPLSAGIELYQVKRDRFPTQRSFCVNVEAASTMLSFEDLTLLETVIQRWSSRAGKVEKSKVDSDTSLNGSFDKPKHTSMPRFQQPLLSSRSQSEKENLGNESFGFFDCLSDLEQVQSVDEMIPLTSGNQRTRDDAAIAQSAPNDLTSLVAESEFSSCTASTLPKYFTLKFHRGREIGLRLEKSACGDVPVVTGVDGNRFRHAVFCTIGQPIDLIEHQKTHLCSPAENRERPTTMTESESAVPEVPMPGAVIVVVDSITCCELGYSETMSLLDLLSGRELQQGSDIFSAENAPPVDEKESYSITFLEMNSVEWGSVDKVDARFKDLSLTFIDDFCGRDMPLFRGRLAKVEFHVERGLGISTEEIDVAAPAVFMPTALVTAVKNTQDEGQGLLSSDIVLKFYIVALTTLDYFNPRVSVWEPMLESCQLCLSVERQTGMKSRPGQLSVTLSDHLNAFEQDAAIMESPKSICLNVTDASAEVSARLVAEWNEWRKNAHNRDNIDMRALIESESVSQGSNTFLWPREKERLSREGNVPRTLDESIPSENSRAHPQRDTSGGNQTSLRQTRAKKAAQVALHLAKKHVAGTHSSGDSAKPLVFRNRTGLSLSFKKDMLPAKTDSSRDLWTGTLGDSTNQGLTEVDDGCEARFEMHLTEDVAAFSNQSDKSNEDTIKNVGKMIRKYGDGQNFTVSVVFRSNEQTSFDPLAELPVTRVGSRIRYLHVRSLNDDNESIAVMVPVVWTVEIENNRRLLTLSSAVCLMSLGLDTTIEIGVRQVVGSEEDHVPLGSIADADNYFIIESIGFAKPGSPFFLPVGLAINNKSLAVYVRPSAIARGGKQSPTYQYSWAMQSVLELRETKLNQHSRSSFKLWRSTFSDVCSLYCYPNINPDNVSALCLSCYSSTTTAQFTDSSDSESGKAMRSRRSSFGELNNDPGELLTVVIDAGLTLRNMLPHDLEWEIARGPQIDSLEAIDGSTTRHDRCRDKGLVLLPYSVLQANRNIDFSLPAGDCAEVFAFDMIGEKDVFARFRFTDCREWSTWAPIAPRETHEIDPDLKGTRDADMSQSDSVAGHHEVRQLSVKIPFGIGAPLTIGLKLVPKIVDIVHGKESVACFGLEVIAYAEIWIRNLTSLPLNFGCPSAQFDARGHGNYQDDEEAGKAAAEAALMEIASVLELGEKGILLHSPRDDIALAQGDTCALPYQVGCVCDEVFEYVEVESSTVIRRWWASEKHNMFRQRPDEFGDKGDSWHWIDDKWMIDCTGQAVAREGGWESCRSLVGAKENTFSGLRTFNPSHRFRRRRWFRRRQRSLDENEMSSGGVDAFHHPAPGPRLHEGAIINNSWPEEVEGKPEGEHRMRTNGSFKISMKCGDGQWSLPAVVPERGHFEGVIRVVASRWPTLTKTSDVPSSRLCFDSKLTYPASQEYSCFKGTEALFNAGNLSPEAFELCYSVTSLGRDYDDFSRLMLVSPRFMLRNDSRKLSMEVKQSGASNASVAVLRPGEVAPFHWADIRLPELVCVRPLIDRNDGIRLFRWSGGVDISNIGMVAVRVRRSRVPRSSAGPLAEDVSIRSVRALVEIRPGTGGTGINMSFKEENFSGDGSLFRVENLSPFPIWISQDGVLANPTANIEQLPLPPIAEKTENEVDLGGENTVDRAEADGDLVPPFDQIPFALDVPFRQGKYAGRKAATAAELLRVRTALAPLSSREGIESTKVSGFMNVGRCFRLNPSKLTSTLSDELIEALSTVRVLGVVTTDGPTRLIRFCLVRIDISPGAFVSAFADSPLHRTAPYGVGSSFDNRVRQQTTEAAVSAAELAQSGQLVSEDEAKQQAFFGTGIVAQMLLPKNPSKVGSTTTAKDIDLIMSFRASFEAFNCSLVDSAPSEIAVATMRSVSVLAKWNTDRTDDASALISIGWLQVDNHVPGAPFSVAICPDDEKAISEGDNGSDSSEKEPSLPLLLVGLTFAPKHKSGILCLRSATISPRNIAIGIDLASIVRFLNFIDGINKHLEQAYFDAAAPEASRVSSTLDGEQKQRIFSPKVNEKAGKIQRSALSGIESQNLYFEGLSISPCRVRLSVSQSRALTPAQASLEGREVAAVHAAVRKGDLLIGTEGSVLGVHVGGKNRTALAVVRGVLKSIIVDALLRCDGASLNFSGVFLRHHISSTAQLKTYLGAHYRTSLRQNLPALIGSLAAFGNPLGLIRGIGDGVSDFGTETVKGIRKGVQEQDATFVVDGVARGTESLARHAVGGFADSASLLTETFSKNMAVLTLDRRYAQRRDRRTNLRDTDAVNPTFVEGVESGVAKLVRGFLEGVTGVVRAPIRGAEKRGMEGFAKGIGKGLLGLLVKPMIGISDAATDVMLGVKGSVEGGGGATNRAGVRGTQQIRPRRPLYGRDGVLRPYNLADAAACALMLRTRLAGEKYLSHCDLEDRVALLSVKRFLLLGEEGQELLLIRFKNIKDVKVRQSVAQKVGDGTEWRIIIVLKHRRADGSEVEVIKCDDKKQADELAAQTRRGMNL